MPGLPRNPLLVVGSGNLDSGLRRSDDPGDLSSSPLCGLACKKPLAPVFAGVTEAFSWLSTCFGEAMRDSDITYSAAASPTQESR